MAYDTTHAWAPEQAGDWQLGSILTGEQDGTGREVIYDAEGDGILHASGSKKAVTQFWCIAACDTATGEEFYWGVDLGPDSLAQGLRFLAQCKRILAHNGIGYDYPASERLYPWWKRPAESWDTLVICKCLWPMEVLIGPDMGLVSRGILPAHMLKRQSLEAWGYRTGTHKGDYKGGFDEWCPAMAIYLMGDIRGTMALWKLIKSRLGWIPDPPDGTFIWPELAIEVENEVARIIHEQHEDGVRFDVEAAQALARDLANQKAALGTRLQALFPPWWEPQDDPTCGKVATVSTKRKLTEHPDVSVPRISPKTGKALAPYVGPPLEECTAGEPFVRIVYTEFLPSSRQHLAGRLQAVYGWKPKLFGKSASATVDETTLEAIPESVLCAADRQTILDYFVVSKTYATLMQGTKSWLNMVGKFSGSPDDGRIHGDLDTVGAITRRGTHKNPNLSGCPKVKVDKHTHLPILGLAGRFGYECRSLYTADEGWEMTGVDACALELIDLGHYLYPLDGGKFSIRVSDPDRDPHQEHADLTGLERDEVKTATYLKVYGGSAYKLSLDVMVEPGEIPALLSYKGLSGVLKGLEKRFDADFVHKLDDTQKARISKARQIIVKLDKGITGLTDLIENISAVATARGWLKGMDGSKIHVRKAYASLNSLLQSAGAMSCKLWMMLVHRELAARGLVRGRDYKQVLWVHDELQFTHRPGLGPLIREVAEECMVKAGEMLHLRGRYRTAGKTATNWAQTH